MAIKFIQLGRLQPELMHRFTAERQIMARLQHPNVTQILDGGLHDGQPYLVMEYVKGEPFKHDLRTPRREQLNRFMAVCGAVGHAHDNLILHRDIKPDNILVTAAGVPKLLDFGIAKLMETVGSGDTLTAAGAAPFTLQYAAPEVVVGKPATVRSDLYALGVLLYELITGRRPYQLKGMPIAEAAQLLPVIFNRFDALLVPSAPGEAPAGLDFTGDAIMNRIWSYLGVPCVSLPFATGANGLPIGVQIVGAQGEDEKVLSVAAWAEAKL